jgi:hypothetical protein
MRTVKTFGAAWLLILLAGGIQGWELPRATMQHGAFGLPDPGGTRLLTVSDLLQPAMLHTAFCSDGRRFPVRFERRQAEREGHNGRQTPSNFDKLAGDVFAVLQGKIDAGASCFLASDRLSSATLLPAELPDGASECAMDVRRRLVASRGRQVANCWLIARLPAARSLVLVEFSHRDKDALASLVLIERHRMIFADYPAVFRREGEDLWRVDDGGVLSYDHWLPGMKVIQDGAYPNGCRRVGAETHGDARSGHTEDQSIRADADGQQQHRGSGKHRAPRQQASAEA